MSLTRLAAAEGLEPIYMRSMRWSDAVGALRAQLQVVNEGKPYKQLLRRLAEVQEAQLEDLEGALGTYAELFAEDPQDRANHDALLRLTRVLDRWGILGDAYDAALQKVEIDDATSVGLVKKAATLYEEKLDDNKKAIAYYQRAVRYDASDEALCDKLSAALERAGKWQALVDFTRDREGFAQSEEEQVLLLHRVAAIEIEKLDHPADAVEIYRRILELSPDDTTATTALTEALSRQSRWNELADHLFWQADRCQDSAQRLSLTTRIGEVFDKRLGERDKAIDLYEEVLNVDSENDEARQALEAIVIDEQYTYRVCKILETTYERLGEWRKRVVALEAMAKSTNDENEKAAILGQAGILHEEFGDDAHSAFNAWGRALVADPHDAEAKSNVDRLAKQTGLWADYVNTMQTTLGGAADLELRLSLLNDVAVAYDRQLGDPRAAITAYQTMVELDPTADETLDELEGLQTMVGDWPGLIDVLEKKADRAQEMGSRTALLSRVGHAWDEQLGDSDRAIAVFDRITEEDGANLEAWESLDRLYAQQSNFPKLGEVLERRLELEPEDEDRVELGLRLATLYEHQLNNSDRATDLLRRVVEIAPLHLSALERFASILRQRGDFAELANVLGMQFEATEADDERIAILHRMGLVYEQNLDDEHRAVETFGQSVEFGFRPRAVVGSAEADYQAGGISRCSGGGTRATFAVPSALERFGRFDPSAGRCSDRPQGAESTLCGPRQRARGGATRSQRSICRACLGVAGRSSGDRVGR